MEEIDLMSKMPAHRAAVIFKHSTRCSISRFVLKNLNQSWHFSHQELPFYFLDLLAHRSISNKVAEHYDVVHQSPQLLLIKNGKCVYNKTHEEISSEDVAGFLEKLK
ncbi:MAG TPA: bacillithiol system redox-active protein YtxJ [Bacteroidia bacterium]|nr:bacillithiol system redox-active protein YtxJ [Bacteroidia bacterium]